MLCSCTCERLEKISNNREGKKIELIRCRQPVGSVLRGGHGKKGALPRSPREDGGNDRRSYASRRQGGRGIEQRTRAMSFRCATCQFYSIHSQTANCQKLVSAVKPQLSESL